MVSCYHIVLKFVFFISVFLIVYSENTYNEFVRNCNTFFMEVVSQLCFAGRNPPSDDVVIKLLSYITVQSKKGWMYSKNIEVIDDAFDRTPVVRSFLLQLLMRTRYSAFIYIFGENTDLFTPL